MRNPAMAARKVKRRRARRNKANNSRTFVDRKQGAAYIHVSPTHFGMAVRRGDIPEYYFGPYLRRYTIEDLDAYAEKCKRLAKADK
jgi:hypothetical protein